ncbi:tetratricopeptide repeat protein [Paraburkholderia sp. JPY432]|uniref:tetratricopeptide repeat-containing glycosyltransferase family protein n=1 Tax=Paraburkholderia youngii TaxID=2782701 RepID=UPI0015960EA5|nr:tetratricopeptide repeat-containing glycosyltransferase family protein [Paraburkholderia youngii]NVH78362.1 tetratricopeptide repeat protein [Paraburkholderia youngii]
MNLFEVAVAAHRAGQLVKAEAAYRQLLSINTAHADAMHLLGVIELQRGRPREAEVLILAALTHRKNAVFMTDLGVALGCQSKHADSEAAFRKALEFNPDLAEAHNHLGILLVQTQRAAEAEAAFRRVTDLRPDSAEAWSNLGQVLGETGQLAEAEAALRHALLLKPDHAEGHNNFGILLSKTERYAHAEAALKKALELNANYAAAYNNLGHLLSGIGRFAEAEPAFVRALDLNPDYVDARFNLSLLLLATGRYAEAWPNYEARYSANMSDRKMVVPGFSYPQWQGEPLAGKSLVLLPEQGFGDCIQFARYMPLLKGCGSSRISVVCDPDLAALLATVDGVDDVITDSGSVPEHDYWTFPLSLPMHFGTTVDTIPGALPYVHAAPGRLDYWRNELPAEGLRIGLVWKGRETHGNDRNRSLRDISVLAPLWSVPGLTFVSLQHGQGDESRQASAGQPLVELGAKIKDFADTAAIVAQLDLTICVDTAIAHVAGALGKPCWVLLPAFGCDWRWLQNRTDSPWYPGAVSLFRQSRFGDWRETIEDVATALRIWAATARSRC